MSLEFDEKNKRMASDLRKILTELKRITKGNLEIMNICDNEIELDAELSDNKFEKLKDWLRSNGYIDVNGAQNWITHYNNYDEYYITEEYRKIDNDWNYTDNSLVLEYYRVKSNDKEYYILKKIYFEGRK